MNNIRFNTFLFAFLNFGERLIGFVTLPLITKTVSDSNYAVWTQTIITTGLLTPIIVFGCGTSLVKFYPLHKESIFKIIRVMFFVILSVFMVFATTTLIFKDSFSVLIFGDQSYSYLILPLLLLLLGEALFEFFVGFMRAKNIINFISLYLFLKGLLRLLILYIVLVILDKNMYEVIFYFSLTQLIFVLSLYLIHFPINKVFLYSAVIKIEVYKEIVKFSAPLVPISFLIGLGNFSDRYFLANTSDGLSEVAIYSATSSLVGVAAFFYSSIGFTLFPRLAAYWSIGDINASRQMFVKILQIYFTVIIPFIFGVTILGDFLLISITTLEYFAPSPLFLILALNVSMFGLYQICYYIQLLEHGSLNGLYWILISTLSNLILNLLLIPKFGIFGAAFSGLVSTAILSINSLNVAYRVLNWRFPWRALLVVFGHSIIMACALLLLKSIITMQNFYSIIGEIFFAVIIYAMMNFSSKSTSLKNLVKN